MASNESSSVWGLTLTFVRAAGVKPNSIKKDFITFIASVDIPTAGLRYVFVPTTSPLLSKIGSSSSKPFLWMAFSAFIQRE